MLAVRTPPHVARASRSCVSSAFICTHPRFPLLTACFIRSSSLSFQGRFRAKTGSFRGRLGVVLGSFRGRFGVVLGSIWGRFGVDLGSVYCRLLAHARRLTPHRPDSYAPSTPPRAFFHAPRRFLALPVAQHRTPFALTARPHCRQRGLPLESPPRFVLPARALACGGGAGTITR